jgi:hypothetical protein
MLVDFCHFGVFFYLFLCFLPMRARRVDKKRGALSALTAPKICGMRTRVIVDECLNSAAL